jgi:hypothetical protein
MAQYQVLQTPHAPTFADNVHRGLKEVQAEVQRRHGPTLDAKPTSNSHHQKSRVSFQRSIIATRTEINGTTVADFTKAALSFQPSLRAEVEDLMANKWMNSGSKLQLLDTLHNRSESAYVNVPMVSKSGLQVRERDIPHTAGGEDSGDDNDDHNGVTHTRTRTRSICEATHEDALKYLAVDPINVADGVTFDASHYDDETHLAAAGKVKDDISIANVNLPSIAAAIPVVVDDEWSSNSSPGMHYFAADEGESYNKHHGVEDVKTRFDDLGSISDLPVLDHGESPPVSFGKNVHMIVSPMGSVRSTPFGSPVESPFASASVSRASSPPLPTTYNPSSDRDEDEVGLYSPQPHNNISSGRSISGIFRKYKDDPIVGGGGPFASAVIPECTTQSKAQQQQQQQVPQLHVVDEQPASTATNAAAAATVCVRGSTVVELNKEFLKTTPTDGTSGQQHAITQKELEGSLERKVDDIRSLVQKIENRAFINDQTMQKTLSVEIPPVPDMKYAIAKGNNGSKEAPTHLKLSPKKEDFTVKFLPSDQASPPHIPSLGVPTSPSSVSSTPSSKRGNEKKSPYLTSNPHRTYAPHNFHIGAARKITI